MNKNDKVRISVVRRPEDPFRDEVGKLFDAVKLAAELWRDPRKRPKMPKGYKFINNTSDVGNCFTMSSKLVQYVECPARLGIYTFMPDVFTFSGVWQILLEGSMPIRMTPEGLSPTSENETDPKLNVEIWAPIGPYGTVLYRWCFHTPRFFVDLD